MKTDWVPFRRGVPALLLLAAMAAGCGAPVAHYRPNRVYIEKEAKIGRLNAQQQRDVQDILGAMFGTPDDPVLPISEGVDFSELFEHRKLQMATGPVWSDVEGRPHGLYREHCVHCHGITGDGAGPTAAFLNPYPRDYRRGTFKFKSTKGDSPPTHDDLHRILVNGIPGTAMPSFKLLDEDELEALVQYVQFLAIRGQVERLLISESASELDAEAGDRLIDLSLAQGDAEQQAAFAAQIMGLTSFVGEVAEKWVNAEDEVTPVPEPPEDWNSPESVNRGRELFFTTITNCSKCHGDTALGDGQTTDYDEWTQEWTVKIGINPKKDVGAVNKFLALGALTPRNAQPRDLRSHPIGVYRGGRRPLDIFRRIKQGIAGTPMPAASAQLSDDDIWHLVDYVRSLPYESVSTPKGHDPKFQRDRS